MPLVSVVIPLFNSGAFVVEALQSVEAQTGVDMEVIVVDDGSEDRGPALVSDYDPRIMLLHQANQGPGAARNTGIERSTGEYLAFLDADDVWVDGKLEAQLAVFYERPEVDFVFGKARQFYEKDAGAGTPSRFQYSHEVLTAHLPSALLAKRTSFIDVGMFPPGRIGTELDWYLRAREAGKVVVDLDEVVYRRRIHDRNTGIVYRSDEHDKLAILRAALQRRRGERPNPQ